MHQKRKTVFAPLLLVVLLAAFAVLAQNPAPAATSPAGLLVTVDITPQLKAHTRPEQVVFIFAKAVNGPRAPLAAVKTRVGDLPLTVTLDDSKALTPRFRLSSFKNVEVSARVSQSGKAMRGRGDLEGISPQVTLGAEAKPVKVVIDHILK